MLASHHRTFVSSHRWIARLALLVTLLAAPRLVAAETPDAFDRRILAELQATSPGAAKVFEEANAAREKLDLARARELYAEVRSQAPGFYHATRRLCGVEMRLGHRGEAIALCREALGAARTSPNLSTLAAALLSGKPERAEVSEAKSLAVDAMEVDADDPFGPIAACEAALRTDDLPLLHRCSKRLDAIAPGMQGTLVFATFTALTDGRYADARDSLEKAREGGMPPDDYHRLSSIVDDATPFWIRAWSLGWRVTVVWLGAFGLLLGLGVLLSRASLRALKQAPRGANGQAQGRETWVRRLYAGVLWLCCLFYYASMPLVGAVVIAAGGALILGFFAVGHIPIKLVAIIAIVTLSTVWAIVKSLFVRGKDGDPGTRLDLRDHPKLDAVLDEVARTIGTRRVDSVYLTPGTDVAVMERGKLRRQLQGKAERCLILGAGVFKGMKVLELKSVLAHEHGHYKNEDTAGGGFALAVRRSLHAFVVHLARAGAAGWYNPAWWFARGFHRVFLVISQGASRLQEVLADRWAVSAYGSAAFERGLSHVIERSVTFDAHVNATLSEVVKDKRPLQNLYRYTPAEAEDTEAAVEKALHAEPSAYDSHPSPQERFAAAREQDIPAPEATPDDEKPVWTLFSDRKAIEREMTNEVRESVSRSFGVSIPTSVEEAEAD